MQAEAETILEMSETLQSANFTKDQSDAFIQSVALAMSTFAVTPELLDGRLANLRQEWKKDLTEQKATIDELKGTVDELKGNVDGLKDTMHDLRRSVLNYLLGFTLVILAGLVGTLGTLGALLAS